MEDWECIPKQTDLISFGLLQTVLLPQLERDVVCSRRCLNMLDSPLNILGFFLLLNVTN